MDLRQPCPLDQPNVREELAQRGYIAVNDTARKIRFAVVGDVHGQYNVLCRQLEALQHQQQQPLDFVLQVGDIECHRHAEDLLSMAAPSKHRQLGDFATTMLPPAPGEDNTNETQQQNSWNSFFDQHPMYFIGGNHECYGWLDHEEERTNNEHQQNSAMRVARDVFYLGRAGYLPLRLYRESSSTMGGSLGIAAVLHVAFVSGIHRENEYYTKRPAMNTEAIDEHSNKSWSGFNVWDIQTLLEDDEQEDGTEHNTTEHNNTNNGGDNNNGEEVPVNKEFLSPRQLLMFVFGRLLGITLTQEQLDDDDADDDSFDVLLSAADIQFLSRILFPANDKRRGPFIETMPNSIVGIVNRMLPEEPCSINAAMIYVNQLVQKRLQRKRAVDVLLTHDWPGGVVDDAVAKELAAEDGRNRSFGNPVCTELLRGLKPTLHCCGHMHRGHRQQIRHTKGDGSSGKKTTQLACLGKVGLSGSAAIAIYEFDLETGEITEVSSSGENS